MCWDSLRPAWSPADVDAARVWARSGGEWLTMPEVEVPVRMVRGAAGLVEYLDRHGAGLAHESAADGVALLGERASLMGLSASGAVSCGRATRLLETSDGWLAVTLARADDIVCIPAWLGVDGGDDPWHTVADSVRPRRSAELVDRATSLGMACASVGEVSSLEPVRGLPLGAAPPRPLSGTVVANLASLWAGPLAADVLARLGATVITVESSSRPDGSRLTPSLFRVLHGNCSFVALPLETESGRSQLRALLERVDVVIEGSRPRALHQMGIEAVDLVARGPQVWISITGYGREDPASHRVGFGDDTAAAGNLVGSIRDRPVFLADAVADPLTGLTAAATVVQLLGQGGRWLVDVALSRVAASFARRPADDRLAPTGRPDPPSSRTVTGPVPPLGRDTDRVLRELGVSQ